MRSPRTLSLVFPTLILVAIAGTAPAMERSRGLEGHISWEVPEQVHDVALTALPGWISIAYRSGIDSLAVPRDDITLGEPFPSYSIPDDRKAEFLADPDPAEYATRVTFLVPIVADDSTLGSGWVVYFPSSRELLERGLLLGDDDPAVIRNRVLDRPEISRVLGHVRFDDLCEPDERFACLDTMDALVWIEIPRRAEAVRSASTVLIGRPRDVAYRAFAIVDYGDTSNVKPWRRQYFDQATIEVEAVLKGRSHENLVAIFYESGYVDSDTTPRVLCPPVVKEGVRKIFALQDPSLGVIPRRFLSSQRDVIPMRYLDDVVRMLPGTPRSADAIRDTLDAIDAATDARLGMARGALAGPRAGDVAFVLGTLSDYNGRRFRPLERVVDHFYSGEGDVLRAILPVYRRAVGGGAAAESVVVDTVRNDFYVHSEELSTLVNSYYHIVERGHDAQGTLIDSLLDGADDRVKLEFVAGAYTRFGKAWAIRGANMAQKCSLLARFLTDLVCSAEHTCQAGLVPVPNTVTFTPTQAVADRLAKTGQLLDDWSLAPVIDDVTIGKLVAYHNQAHGFTLYHPRLWTPHEDARGELSYFSSTEGPDVEFRVRPAPADLGASVDSVYVNYWERFQEANWEYDIKQMRRGYLGRRRAIEVPRTDFSGSLFIFDFEGEVYLAELSLEHPQYVARFVLSTIRRE